MEQSKLAYVLELSPVAGAAFAGAPEQLEVEIMLLTGEVLKDKQDEIARLTQEVSGLRARLAWCSATEAKLGATREALAEKERRLAELEGINAALGGELAELQRQLAQRPQVDPVQLVELDALKEANQALAKELMEAEANVSRAGGERVEQCRREMLAQAEEHRHALQVEQERRRTLELELRQARDVIARHDKATANQVQAVEGRMGETVRQLEAELKAATARAALAEKTAEEIRAALKKTRDSKEALESELAEARANSMTPDMLEAFEHFEAWSETARQQLDARSHTIDKLEAENRYLSLVLGSTRHDRIYKSESGGSVSILALDTDDIVSETADGFTVKRDRPLCMWYAPCGIGVMLMLREEPNERGGLDLMWPNLPKDINEIFPPQEDIVNIAKLMDGLSSSAIKGALERIRQQAVRGASRSLILSNSGLQSVASIMRGKPKLAKTVNKAKKARARRA